LTQALKLRYEVRGFVLVTLKKLLAHAVGETVVVDDVELASDRSKGDNCEDAAVFTVSALLGDITPHDCELRPPATHHLVYCRAYNV
jgi:hypothetical protein